MTMGQDFTLQNWEMVIRAMGSPKEGMGRGLPNQLRGQARGVLRRGQGQYLLRWR